MNIEISGGVKTDGRAGQQQRAGGTLSSSRNDQNGDLLLEFTEGVDFDAQMYREEIAVQKAWARQLQILGVLRDDESEQACLLLDEAAALIAAGTFDWRKADEDIHMNLERFVTDRAGDIGKKMHLGRSRNDLIATTLRLKVASLSRDIDSELAGIISPLAAFCRKHVEVIIPGLTHMQHGQPVRLAHALSAHGWAFGRDRARLRQAAAGALGNLPLGSGALSGTPLRVSEDALCAELGFASASMNSYDSVSDRDFILEFLFALETIATHAYRLCEDLIFYSSGAVRLIRLPKAWSTGSSMMPNKRNPDVLELTRGRANRILGLCQSGCHLIKGVGLSYGSELHELKKTMLMAAAEMRQILGILPHFLGEMELNAERAGELLDHGHILATEVADHLTAQGLPFRDAYRLVAGLVETAESRGCQVHQLGLSALPPDIASHIKAEFWEALGYSAAVEKRAGLAGTSRASVLRALDRLERDAGA